jgi:hypothetical protein
MSERCGHGMRDGRGCLELRSHPIHGKTANGYGEFAHEFQPMPAASCEPCHGKRPICAHPDCKECVEYAHESVGVPTIAPLERKVVEAAMAYYAQHKDVSGLHYVWAVLDACAALDKARGGK